MVNSTSAHDPERIHRVVLSEVAHQHVRMLPARQAAKLRYEARCARPMLLPAADQGAN